MQNFCDRLEGFKATYSHELFNVHFSDLEIKIKQMQAADRIFEAEMQEAAHADKTVEAKNRSKFSQFLNHPMMNSVKNYTNKFLNMRSVSRSIVC